MTARSLSGAWKVWKQPKSDGFDVCCCMCFTQFVIKIKCDNNRKRFELYIYDIFMGVDAFILVNRACESINTYRQKAIREQ